MNRHSIAKLTCGHPLADIYAKAGETNEGLSLYYCKRGCGPRQVDTRQWKLKKS